MSTRELRVTGMTCDHCARTVEVALSKLPGVVSSSVSYGDGKARIEVQDSMDSAALVAAIKAKGYGAELLDGGHGIGAKGARSGRPAGGTIAGVRPPEEAG